MEEIQSQESAYALNPASAISININLSELPKCPHCKSGMWIPLQSTTRPKSGTYTIYNNGWYCIGCGKYFIYDAGKIITNTISSSPEDDNSPL
jgi:transposase-like protein